MSCILFKRCGEQREFEARQDSNGKADDLTTDNAKVHRLEWQVLRHSDNVREKVDAQASVNFPGQVNRKGSQYREHYLNDKQISHGFCCRSCARTHVLGPLGSDSERKHIDRDGNAMPDDFAAAHDGEQARENEFVADGTRRKQEDENIDRDFVQRLMT